jgi:hypothetical protein
VCAADRDEPLGAVREDFGGDGQASVLGHDEVELPAAQSRRQGVRPVRVGVDVPDPGRQVGLVLAAVQDFDVEAAVHEPAHHAGAGRARPADHERGRRHLRR